MKNANSQLARLAQLLAVTAVAFSVCGFVGTVHGAEPGFDGGKSTWHDGFVRYDFVMDGQTLAITPFTRPEKEGLLWALRPRVSGAASWSFPTSRLPAIPGRGKAVIGTTSRTASWIKAAKMRSNSTTIVGQLLGWNFRLPPV